MVILIVANRFLLADKLYKSDDYTHHALRTASYYLSLKQGNVPVRWGPNLNQGYGYPSFNYMYHTPYISGSILHSVGFSIQESLNLTVLLAILLGSISCYIFVKSYLKSEVWSVLLALLFILNPYTLLNIYWRGAVGARTVAQPRRSRPAGKFSRQRDQRSSASTVRQPDLEH